MSLTIETVTYFAAVTNSDLTEGRGQEVRIGNYWRKDDAVAACVGRGPGGFNGWVRQMTATVLRHVETDAMYLLGQALVVQ